MEILIISFFAGLICFIMPRKNEKLPGIVAILSSFACLYFSIRLFISKQIYYSGFGFVGKFFADLGLFKIDNLNSFLPLFICFFVSLIALYSFSYVPKNIKSAKEYYGYFLLTLFISCLVVLANNIVLFLIGWGISALLLYLLIGIQGSGEASDAGKKTLILVGGSDALMILGVAIMWKLTGSLNIDKMHIAVLTKSGIAAFLCFAVAAFAKAGAMPLHTWIPFSSKSAPITVMAVLPASLDKMLGIYLLARCTLSIFSIQQNSFFSVFLMIIGAVTIICAVMMALIQHNFKKLLAYHAVSQVGYMVLGIGTATTIGIAGGLFHMVNNAIYKSCLFLTAGNVESKSNTSDIDELGGLALSMPITFISFLIAALSISGIPPFNGFFSKWMIYQGLIQSFTGQAGRFIIFMCFIAAMFGSALTLASFLKLTHAIFLGQPSPKLAALKIREVSWQMYVPVLVLSFLCVLFGIFAYSLPLKYFIQPAVGNFANTGYYAPLVSTGIIILGILMGLAIYLASRANKTAREDTCFIGGEVLPFENKVSGAEFYNTVKEFSILRNIYNWAEAGLFDIYDQGKKIIFGLGRLFQYLHNGVLPTYLIWALLGMTLLFFVLAG